MVEVVVVVVAAAAAAAAFFVVIIIMSAANRRNEETHLLCILQKSRGDCELRSDKRRPRLNPAHPHLGC